MTQLNRIPPASRFLLYLLFAVATVASDRNARFGAANVIRRTGGCRPRTRSGAPRLCRAPIEQPRNATSHLGATDPVHRAPGGRCCYHQLRIGYARQLGGQSAYEVRPNPLGAVLVDSETGRRRARRGGRAPPRATLADRLCRVVLRPDRIGQSGVPLRLCVSRPINAAQPAERSAGWSY